MIPKALFLSFLSVSLPGQLYHPRHDGAESSPVVIQRVGIAVDGSGVSVPGLYLPKSQAPASLLDPTQKPIIADATDRVHSDAITEIDFDKLPAGDWDPSKIAQGNVRLTAGGTGSGLRIWNVTYAFPAVRLPRGGTHALGNFPEGRGLGIQFTDGAHTNVSVAFGYVVNGQLSTGFYFAGFSRDGRSVARFTGRLAGGWANVTSGAIAADSVSVFIDEGAPSGLTLIGYAEYND